MKQLDTFVSVDIETTGLDPAYSEIIEIGAVKIEQGHIVEEFSRFVKPVQHIPPFITNLTGITNDDVAGEPPVQDVIPLFVSFSRGYPLLGQNVKFDMSFLRRYGNVGRIGPAIDNTDLARILLPQLPSYNLDNLIEFFSLDPGKRHRALDDARVTSEVFLRLISMLRLSDSSFVNGLMSIASKTGGVICELLEAHIRERISGTERKAAAFDDPRKGLSGHNNLFGDFSYDITKAASGKTIDLDEIAALLASGGALSSAYENYEERPGQIALSKAAAHAFNDAELLLAEAGTGVGKSIAYLVPSIIWAEMTRERVIVSTNTKNLQEQLFMKDIPLLSNVLPFPFRAVILKGRGNYICLNRWDRLMDAPERYLSKDEQNLVLPVASWLNESVTGDLSETGFYSLLIESGLLEKINSESPYCLGPRCTHRDSCFVNRVRRAAQKAHVIIVNHSLVFSDMVADGGVLGSYGRLVFDEAHNIERVAMRYLGVTMSYYRIRRVLNRLYVKGNSPHGILAVLDKWIDNMVKVWAEFAVNIPIISEAVEGVNTVRAASRSLFEHLSIAAKAEASDKKNMSEGKLRYYAGSDIFRACETDIDRFSESVMGLAASLEDVIMLIGNVSDSNMDHREETMIELEEIGNELNALLDDMAFLEEAGGRNVFWFEYKQTGPGLSLRINSAPLDIAEKLAIGLYDHLDTVIMTSATLTVARSFSYVRNRLGLNLDTRERTVEFIASSPFDYRAQAAVVLPSFLPSPKEEHYIEESAELIYELAKNTGKGMLVLFTSRGHMHRVYYDLKDRLAHIGITLLGQGVDGSRSLILRQFRENTGSVLFGTDSFWEGVDVPGRALEIVVINRLPFGVPTDPVVQAQMEEVEKSGGNPFIDFQVPEAAIKLRQGAGRLIRHRSDRGTVVILDTRVITARYGYMFKNSLPGTDLEASTQDSMIRNILGWFK